MNVTGALSLLCALSGAEAAPPSSLPSTRPVTTRPTKKAKVGGAPKASHRRAAARPRGGSRIIRKALRIGMSWDFQYEQGFVLNHVDQFSRRWFGRVRAGMIYVHEPWIIALGAVLEGAGVPSLAYGLQIEVTHLWQGFWGQATVSLDADAHVFSALSAGWSLLGFEWQRRLSDGGSLRNAYLLKIRVPLGIALFLR